MIARFATVGAFAPHQIVEGLDQAIGLAGLLEERGAASARIPVDGSFPRPKSKNWNLSPS